MKILQTLFVVLFTFQDIHSEKCLRNLIIAGTESNSISVAWDYSCPHRNILFKVYTEHREFIACQTGQKDGSRGPGVKVLEVTDERSLEVNDLHPYSNYKIIVKAINGKDKAVEELDTLAETKQSTPNIPVLKDSSKPSIISSDKIKFFWKHPGPSSCKDFNGVISQFYYVFKANSPWTAEAQAKRGYTTNTFFEFDGLLPFTSYTLTVYAAVDNNFNTNRGLNLSETTLGSGIIGTPSDLKLERRGTSTYLSWLPSYPPTSEVSRFLIKWKSEHTSFPDIIFFVNNTECLEDLPRLCHSISQSGESLLSANLTFQVKAVGSDSSVTSAWSNEIKYYPSDPNYDGSSSSVATVVVVSIVVVLFVVLIIVGLSYRCRNRILKRYKNVPDYESRHGVSFISGQVSSPPPPPYQLGSSNSFGTPNDHVSIETTSTMFSRQQNNSFSLPTAAPRQKASSKKIQRPPTQPHGTIKVDTAKYQHLLLPNQTPQPKRPGSIQETPLPPVPGLGPKEPIYEDICQDTLLSRRRFKSNNDLQEMTENQLVSLPFRRKSAEDESTDFNNRNDLSLDTFRRKSVNEEEEFLKPNLDPNDDDDYLKPRSLNATLASLDNPDGAEEEYLEPNHGRLELINSRDLSPPIRTPPPIPMQSYTPVKLN